MTPDPHSPPVPRRRDGRPTRPLGAIVDLAVGLVVVALVALVASVLWFTRSPGPPTAAGRAAGGRPTTCDDPCETIEPQVTLEWAPPESGADPTGLPPAA